MISEEYLMTIIAKETIAKHTFADRAQKAESENTTLKAENERLQEEVNTLLLKLSVLEAPQK